MDNTKLNCLALAKIILNGKKSIRTDWGKKTAIGLADLIYRRPEVTQSQRESVGAMSYQLTEQEQQFVTEL